MPGKLNRLLLSVLALGAGIAAAACGTVATPEWAAEAQGTQAALLATSEHLTEIAPTFTPTPQPTATPAPTEAPTEVPTEPPTAVPTEEVTAEATSEAEAAGMGNAEVTGDPVNGQVVFTTMHNTANGTWSCSMCHSVTPDEARLIGPGLWNVSINAETRVAGQSAFDYIHESIVNPDAFIAPGDPPFPSSLMPQNWEEVLTPEELNDVIAYLYTLHD